VSKRFVIFQTHGSHNHNLHHGRTDNMMASQTNTPDEKKMHVIIIGSGCTGLFIAQGLKKVRRRKNRRSPPSAETSSPPFPRGASHSVSMTRSIPPSAIGTGA
jgi:hypothetical protein